MLLQRYFSDEEYIMQYMSDFKHRETHEARMVYFNYFEEHEFSFQKVLEEYNLTQVL